MGAALENAGDEIMHQVLEQKRLLKQQKEEDARAYAGKALSDAHVYWDDNLEKRQESAAPGAPNFTPGVLQDYDKWTSTAVQQAPTDAAKKYLTAHLTAYRTQLYDQALSFESGARIGYRADQYNQSVDNWAVTVAKDPSKYNLGLSALTQTLPEVGPIQKQKLQDYMKKSLVQAAMTGMIQSNPTVAYNLLNKSTLPEDTSSPATSSADNQPVPANGSGNRGIRNNNPGNIVQSNVPWVGKVAGNDPRFEAFDSPEAGIRAIGKNLISYQDEHGRNTITSIVSAWAPANDHNDTATYISNVSKALGVKPDEPLNVKDPSTMTKLVKAIIDQENGVQPYSDAQIATGVNAALGKGDLPPPVANTDQTGAPAAQQGTEPSQVASGSGDTKTGVPWIDDMDLKDRLHYLQAADTEIRRRQQIAQAGLELKEKDQNAQALSGKPVTNPLTLGDYVRAYGQAEGIRRYGEFRDNQQFGLNLNQVSTMTPQAQTALLAKNQPIPNSPGFADDQKRFVLLQHAIQTANDQRQKDPVTFAATHGTAKLNPINFADPNSIKSEFANRTVMANQNVTNWGTPYKVLTQTEADFLGKYLGSLQPQDKARVLGEIYQSAGPSGLRSIAGQLKDKNNDLAIAGMLASQHTTAGRDVAQLYLEGKDAIAQGRAKIDQTKETGIKASIYSALDGVYMTPQARDAAADAAYGVYAKLKTEGDDDWQRALRIATGGIMEFNGSKIVRPYGWDDSRFQDTLNTKGPALIAAASKEYIAGNHKVSAEDLAKFLPGAKLQTYGDGSYMIKAGSDVVRLPNGQPFILQMGP